MTINHAGIYQKSHHHHHHDDHHHHPDDHYLSEIMERSGVVLDEELEAALGPSVYPNHLSGGETNNRSSPHDHEQLDFDYPLLDLQPNFCYPHIDPLSHILPRNHANINLHENTSNQRANNPLQLGARSTESVQHEHHQSAAVAVGDDDHDQISNSKMSKKADDHDNHDKKQAGPGGGASTGSKSTKRRREPSQVQDHILAERKRRELLGTQFISLSAIVPGLKKTDKTSVLGEAIKYMKELKEKVKALEEEAAKRTVESVVVVKKSQLVVADDDNEASSSVDDSCIGGRGGESLPEIEVKVSDKSMLIKVYCEKRKGTVPKLFQEVEKLGLNVINCSVIPFGILALDITILAQMERELNANVKDVITSLGSALSPPVG